MTDNRYLQRLKENFVSRREQIFCRMVTADGEIALTWSDLERDSSKFLAAYDAAGVRTGGQVLIFLRHVPELYGSFFGAMLGGFVPSFMPCTSPKQDPKIYWSSHSQLLQQIQPAAMVASSSTFDEMLEAGLDIASIPRVVLEDVEATAGEFTCAPETAIALLQHSSGTTGLKKGVALAYSAIIDQVEGYGETLKLDGRDVIVSWLPLYHDMGLIACCILPAYFGVPIVHLDPFHWLSRPELLFDYIQRCRGTLTWLPNFAFDHLVNVAGRKANQYQLSDMKAFINCSEPCKARTFDRFVKTFGEAGVAHGQLQCCYAMAETVFAVSQTDLGRPVRRLLVDQATVARGLSPQLSLSGKYSVELIETGRTIPGIVVTVRDEARNVLPDGVVGEIVVSGTYLFSGYNKDPERTAEKMQDGVYFTGDVGFVREGHLYVLGRTDDMIIINGRNFFAHEVEAVIGKVDGLKPGRSVALSVFDETLGSTVLIVVGEKERASVRSDRDIRSEVLTQVRSTFGIQPRKVEIVNEGWLVKTTSGKISRKENAAKLLAHGGHELTLQG